MQKIILFITLLLLPLAAYCGDTMQVTQNDYDNLQYVGYDYYITEKNNKYGVVYKYKQIIEPEYDKIDKIFQESKYIIVEKDGKKGIFKGSKKISPVIYDDIKNIKTYNKKIWAFLLQEKGKYGIYTDCLYKNKNGYYHNRKIAVPIEYDEITFYQQKSKRDNIFAMGFIVKKNNKCGYYDIQMGEILPTKYSDIITVDYDDNVILALKTMFFIFDVSETKKIFNSKAIQKNSFWAKLKTSCKLPWNKNRCKAVKK